MNSLANGTAEDGGVLYKWNSGGYFKPLTKEEAGNDVNFQPNLRVNPYAGWRCRCGGNKFAIIDETQFICTDCRNVIFLPVPVVKVKVNEENEPINQTKKDRK